MSAPIWQWLAVALAGACWGGWLDRGARRLGLEQSFFWPPRSHCTRCWQPVRWVHAIPLVGPLLCRFRCSTCGAPLPRRPIVVEVITAALLVALFGRYLGHRGPFHFPFYPLPYHHDTRVALFVYHALLVSLLIVATLIDLDWMIIPDSVTVPGMVLGVGLGTFWYVELHPVPLFSPPLSQADLVLWPAGASAEGWLGGILGSRLEPARAWVNLEWHHHWNWGLGFATGMVGLLAGGGMVWIVRAICSWAFGKEAMGFGDVTLMAMIGSFLGWQGAVLAFFLAPLSAVVVGVGGWAFAGRGELPYGPHLSVATVIVLLFWREIWPLREVQLFFGDSGLFWSAGLILVVALVAISILVAWGKRLFDRLRRPADLAEGP